MGPRSASSLLAVISLLVIPLPCLSRTWYILPDGSGDAPTIQAAIDSAGTGDIVELADGVYVGYRNRSITYGGKDVTVKSASGQPENCVIDCESAAFGFRLVGVDAPCGTLEGVTVRNGIADYGGAVFLANSSAILDNCVFDSNSAVVVKRGGAVYCEYSSPTISDVRFVSNTAGWGGGLYLYECSAAIEGCSFTGNEVEYQGGAVFTESSYCLILDSFLMSNRAQFGGAVRFLLSSAEVEGCVVARNSASFHGGGLYIVNTYDVSIHQATISHNSAGQMGGGIFASAFQASVDATIIWGNGAGMAGGEIYLYDSGDYLGYTCSDVRASGIGGPGSAGDWGGSIDEDPLYCDPENGDYHLHSSSPCLPEVTPCGVLIGALGQGCGPVALEPSTWALIKSRYW